MGYPYISDMSQDITDVSTLITVACEIEQYGVSVNHTILDTGYFSGNNAAELFERGISFMTRLVPQKAFKDTTAENLNDQFYSDIH